IAVAVPTAGLGDPGSRRDEVGNRSAAEDAAAGPRRAEGKRLGPADPGEHPSTVRDRPADRGSMAASGHKRAPGSFPVDLQFEDAVTRDGGRLRVPRPDPPGSLYGCASARCGE